MEKRVKELKSEEPDLWTDFRKLEKQIEKLEIEDDNKQCELNELRGKISDLRCLFENHYHKNLETILKGDISNGNHTKGKKLV